MRAAIAQIAPVFLNRERTAEKIRTRITEAAAEGCDLIVFSETLLPGYPVWLERTGGARFNNPDQKLLYAHYLDQCVDIAGGDLDGICESAADAGIAVVLGIAERSTDNSGHTIYCSRVIIDHEGAVLGVHRKLMPTYEEKLVWGQGDGQGLRCHDIGEFRLGALNCWENWMPLARAALYADGETLHAALWPGSLRNTADLTRFIAMESRSYVLSASGLLRASDIPSSVPLRERMIDSENEIILNGGSAAAGPDGTFLLEPQCGGEGLFLLELDATRVREERQNFDPAGHYARRDVLQLKVDRRSLGSAEFLDGSQA